MLLARLSSAQALAVPPAETTTQTDGQRKNTSSNTSGSDRSAMEVPVVETVLDAVTREILMLSPPPSSSSINDDAATIAEPFAFAAAVRWVVPKWRVTHHQEEESEATSNDDARDAKMLMSRAAVEIVLSFTKTVADEASAAMLLQQQQSSSSSPSLLIGGAALHVAPGLAAASIHRAVAEAA